MTAIPPSDAWQPHVWFIAARSTALKRAPLAVTVQNRPLVLFRGAEGLPQALAEACPHRNASLSLGRVVEGRLQCPYHGWQFDGEGRCVALPGLVNGSPDVPARCATTYGCRESQGYIWVYSTPNEVPRSVPFEFGGRAPGVTTVRRRFEVEAAMFNVLENTLDVPHTAFLHGGLFRTANAKQRNRITVQVQRERRWCEARFIGEPTPKGLLARLVAPQGGVVEHVDRFELPSIAIVDYRLGCWQVLSTSVLTPVTPTRTVVWAEVSFRLPLPGWLVAPFVTPVATRIFAQDAALLRAQRLASEGQGGAKYVSSELDVLGPQIAKLLIASAGGLELPSPHQHQVEMET